MIYICKLHWMEFTQSADMMVASQAAATLANLAEVKINQDLIGNFLMIYI